MKNIEKIEQLIEAEVQQRTAAELERRRPEVEAEVEAEITKARPAAVRVRLDELRALTEQTIRAELVEALLNTTAPNQPTIKVDTLPLTPKKIQEILTAALDPFVAARGIRRVKRGWACAFCGQPFNTQRAASIHARSCDHRAAVLNGTALPAEPQPKQRKDVVNKGGKRTCIKPGCKKKSKGPKHHHLCEEHLSAPKKQWQSWQKKDREARAS